jgi:hypothetical protein
LLLPFQVSVLGFTSPAVSATNHLYKVLATPSGVTRYAKEGRMLWPLTWVLVGGTVPGGIIGALVRGVSLPDAAAFRLFAGPHEGGPEKGSGVAASASSVRKTRSRPARFARYMALSAARIAACAEGGGLRNTIAPIVAPTPAGVPAAA